MSIMRDPLDVAKDLARAAKPCFNDVDLDFVEADIAAGEGFYAIDQILRTAVRERFALPEFLVAEVRNVFPVGVVPAKEEARFRPALNDVRVVKAA